MRLDRVRRAGIGRERAALLVADRPKQAVELLRAAVHVVGDRGTPVKEERRRALAADVTVERSALDRDLERLLVHQPETTRTWRNMLCAAGGALVAAPLRRGSFRQALLIGSERRKGSVTRLGPDERRKHHADVRAASLAAHGEARARPCRSERSGEGPLRAARAARPPRTPPGSPFGAPPPCRRV